MRPCTLAVTAGGLGHSGVPGCVAGLGHRALGGGAVGFNVRGLTWESWPLLPGQLEGA